MWQASLARRFIVFISLLVLATSLALSLLVVRLERDELDQDARRRALSLAGNFARDAELGVLTRNREWLSELARQVIREPDVVGLRVIDVEGQVLLDHAAGAEEPRFVPRDGRRSEVVDAVDVAVIPLGRAGERRVEAYEVVFPVLTQRRERRDDEIGLILGEPDRPGQVEHIGQARLTLSLAQMHRRLARLQSVIGLLTLVVITVAIALTVVLVRRMVRPLGRLAAATREIAEGHLPEVPVPVSEDEIGRLARSFNLMTAELRRSRRELETYNAGLEQQVLLRTRELEAAQSQLVQAEKLSAVGLLVSGVAHELNNPLAGVIGFSELLLRSELDPRVRRQVEVINRDAERCKKIVQNLQSFARTHKPEKDDVAVGEIIERTLELRAYQLNLDSIRVVTDLQADLPRTMADFHQLQRVFLNIIINAHQAMGSRGHGGELIIRACREGDEIVVRIEDSGPGIAAEHLPQLFDPFFTTKDVGEGTGLGLSICYGIVREHGGTLTAANRPAGGAQFTVRLPVVRPESAATAARRPPAAAHAGPVPAMSVLVVDDEPDILEILTDVLRADGHRVESAADGKMAWNKVQNEHFDLIISDLRMPGMSGQELYARIRERDASLARRIIFSTGDVLGDETHQFLRGSGNRYLQKPFELEALRAAVQDVLVHA